MDTNNDGRLNIRELKQHIKNFECRNLPDYLAKHILRMSDEDSDGSLDFEEFYQLSLRQEWLFSRLVFKYCKMIVPSPHRPEIDETGKNGIMRTRMPFSNLKNTFSEQSTFKKYSVTNQKDLINIKQIVWPRVLLINVLLINRSYLSNQ